MFGRSRNRGASSPSGRSNMAQRLVFLVALLFALVAFVLSLLTLLAGYKPGFMPESYIVLLDTSRLGRELLPARSMFAPALAERQLPSSFDDAKDKLKAEADKAKEEAEKAKDKLKDKADDVIGDIVDGVTGALGVDKYYALHATTVCSGDYANGNNSAGGLNVRRCTHPLEELNIVNVIDLDLKVPGPIRAALDDMDQGAPKVFQAVAGLYIAGTALTGLLVLGGAAAALLPGKARLLSALNLVVASLASVALFAATLITTVAADKIAELVRDKAGRVGLRAEVGTKFRGLSWAAFALAAVATLIWLYAAFTAFRSRRRGHTSWDKGDVGSSTRGASYEMGERRVAGTSRR